MFDQNLLDSSPLRVAVLKRNHLVVSLLAGALAWVAAFAGLPILGLQPETRVLAAQATAAGIVFAVWTLMLCYVGTESRELGLRTWLWVGLTLTLNVVGFFAYLFYSAAKTGDWRRATVPAVYGFEVLLLSGLVLMPLISTAALPKLFRTTQVPPPPPPPWAPRARPRAPKPTRPEHWIDPRVAPPVIPKTIVQINEQPAPPAFTLPGGVGVPFGGAHSGVPNGVLNSLGLSTVTPAAPDLKAPKIVRVSVGGQVEPPRPIYQPQPDYPKLALLTNTQGAVRLEAVISRDGTVEDLKVLSGNPLLVRAALEAVSRWRYQPTLLNGDPVEVVMEFDVNFKLGGR